jgi:hypothetical protein
MILRGLPRRDFIPTFINLKIRGQLITVEKVMISCPSHFSCKGFQAIEYAFPFPVPYQGRFSPAPVNGAPSDSKKAIDRAKLDIL